MMARVNLVNICPLLASVTPLARLIFDHLLWPDMAVLLTDGKIWFFHCTIHLQAGKSEISSEGVRLTSLRGALVRNVQALSYLRDGFLSSDTTMLDGFCDTVEIIGAHLTNVRFNDDVRVLEAI